MKSATIVGRTLAFHAHGETSVYGALVRMAQPHLVRVPFIAGEGNFGDSSLPPAAMRYTNAKLSKLGTILVANLNKEIIPYIDSYDGEDVEPLYLNAPFPVLLSTTTLGIGMGMATSIPSFPIKEIIETTINYLYNPEYSITQVAQQLLPDFPSGCSIVNKNDLVKIYSTGSGSLVLRATFEKNGNNLIINNFPIYSLASKVESQIYEGQENGLFNDILSIIDTSTKSQQLTLRLKTNTDIDNLVKELCLYTAVERNFTFNFQALNINNEPIHYTIPKFFKEWIAIHKNLTRKELNLEQESYKRQLEINQGLYKALLSIDEIITLIKQSKNRSAAKTALQSQGFTELQADAILEIKLSRLTKLEAIELERKINSLNKNIDKLIMLLSDEEKFIDFIADRMKECIKLDIPRQSKVEQSKYERVKKAVNTNFYAKINSNSVTISADLPRGKFVEVSKSNPLRVLQDNYIIPITNDSEPIYSPIWGIIEKNQIAYHFSSDGRVKATKSEELFTSRKAKVNNENIIQVFILPNNHDTKVLLTTHNGKKMQFKLNEVPVTKRGTAKGIIVAKLGNEKIKSIEIIKEFQSDILIGRNKTLK